MIQKLSLALGASGLVLLGLLMSSGPEAGGGLFRPFSGSLTLPVILGLAVGIVMVATALAGLLPDGTLDGSHEEH